MVDLVDLWVFHPVSCLKFGTLFRYPNVLRSCPAPHHIVNTVSSDGFSQLIRYFKCIRVRRVWRSQLNSHSDDVLNLSERLVSKLRIKRVWMWCLTAASLIERQQADPTE